MDAFEFDYDIMDEMLQENMTQEEIEQKEQEEAFAAEQISKYKTHTFESTNDFYLILGIIAVVFVILFELIALFVVPIGWSVLLQIPVICCGFVISLLFDWIKRRNFTIYLVNKKQDPSIEFINEQYIIVDVNQDIIVFVLEEDFDAYKSWKKLQKYDNLYKFEVDYFI